MTKASCLETTTREFGCVYDPWDNRFDVVDEFVLPSSNRNAVYLIKTDENRTNQWVDNLQLVELVQRQWKNMQIKQTMRKAMKWMQTKV
uniref:Uncharacterized protein n=1 Tax=Romanomermis culicivorax TaxID=13658 RepID=A0A915IVA0_ROMCU